MGVTDRDITPFSLLSLDSSYLGLAKPLTYTFVLTFGPKFPRHCVIGMWITAAQRLLKEETSSL